MPPSLDGDGFGDGRALPVFAISRSRLSALPPLGEPLRVLKPGSDGPTAEESKTLDEIRTFLEMVIQGTSVQLASTLEKSLYLGPLRTVQPRGFLFERSGRATRWADGLAAWDLLREPAVEAARREALEPADETLRVVQAGFGDDAGLVGAALVGFEALDGER